MWGKNSPAPALALPDTKKGPPLPGRWYRNVGFESFWLFRALGCAQYFTCCMNSSAFWVWSILPLGKIQDLPVDLSPSHKQVLPVLSFHTCTTFFHHYVRTPWTMTWTKQPFQTVKTCPGKLPITECYHLLLENSFLHHFAEKIKASPLFWSVFYRYKIQL